MIATFNKKRIFRYLIVLHNITKKGILSSQTNYKLMASAQAAQSPLQNKVSYVDKVTTNLLFSPRKNQRETLFDQLKRKTILILCRLSILMHFMS